MADIGSAIAGDLLSGLLDTFGTRKFNDAVVSASADGTKFFDKAGQSVPLYVQPNFLQRVISPTARQTATLNANQSAAPLVAQAQNNMQQFQKKSLMDSALAALPVTGKIYGADDKANAAVADFPIFAPTNVEQQRIAAGANMTNLEQTGKAKALNDGTQTKLVGNTLANRLETFPQEARIEQLRRDLDEKRLRGLDPVTLDTAIRRAVHDKEQLGVEFDTDSVLNQYKNIMAKGALNRTPLTEATALNDAISGNVRSQYTQLPAYANMVLPDGTVSGVQRTGVGMSEEELKARGAQDALNTLRPQVTTLSSGRTVALPQRQTQAVVRTLPVGKGGGYDLFDPTAMQELQTAAHGHQETTDAAEAEALKAEMARLKALKAQTDVKHSTNSLRRLVGALQKPYANNPEMMSNASQAAAYMP